MKKIYNSKWFPRLFYAKPDGGKNSGVTAFFLIEWKILFSIGFLYFRKGTREAYHSHAFNALTWWLKGKVTEAKLNAAFNERGELLTKCEDITREYKPSLIPKFTFRSNFHKVIAHEPTFALTLRGPWRNTWNECRADKIITLTHGRKEIKS